MFEWMQAGEHSYYINSPAKIGVYHDDSQTILIDSGNDKDAGRKIRQLLDQRQWTLTAIVNTHSNADHIGGNAYLQRQTGCKIFAPGIEAAFTRAPILEPSFLYGGYPPQALRHKFLMAQPSDALDFSHPDFPKVLEPIPLPGHFFDMVGLRVPDGTVFLADCLSSAATLEKYQFSFIYDVA
ncbi:MAG: MBL fold metallo-hydrolase, partial [Oscillospiraceae bacterium]